MIGVVLGLIKAVGELVSVGVPQLSQFARIAIGKDPFGTYQLQVLREGTELELTGAIVFGLTDEVRRILNASPTIRSIRLNSNGGRTGEARKLRDLVDSRGLTTLTTSACLSACTLIYAAGNNRLIAKTARLGFHRYSFPGMTNDDLQAQYEKDKQDWLTRGFAKVMVDRAFATPSTEMWTPTHQELLKWGVITGYLQE